MSSALTNWLGNPLHEHYNYQSESHLNGSDLVDYKLCTSSHLILVYCLVFNPNSQNSSNQFNVQYAFHIKNKIFVGNFEIQLKYIENVSMPSKKS